MKEVIRFTLSYEGNETDNHAIDLYDVSQALVGFQRSLALTAHLVLNGEIITQAPSLKGARILAYPAEPGSWKLTATMVLAGAYALGTTEKDSPIGHLVYSLYDYVVSESLGIHVDYERSLGQLYEEAQAAKTKLPVIREAQADSLIEKAERAIIEMHRPIFKTQSAGSASITASINRARLPLKTNLSVETYEFIHETKQAELAKIIEGRVSSYNSNTYKGRIYVANYGRPVTFELALDARSPRIISLITTSLRLSALKQYDEVGATIHCVALENTSKSGHLKSLTLTVVKGKPLSGP